MGTNYCPLSGYAEKRMNDVIPALVVSNTPNCTMDGGMIARNPHGAVRAKEFIVFARLRLVAAWGKRQHVQHNE